jgi:cytidylate kinase
MTAHDHRLVIAIDGPAAAGKSTVAKLVAERMGAVLFDTGALYRSVTLLALRSGTHPQDEEKLTALARDHRIEIRPPSVDDGRQVDVLLDGQDVTWALRTPEIDAQVSAVSAHPPVRRQLLDVQRDIADGARMVMVGRDIGTVVIPNAGTKIFLEASVEERARRRLVEMQERGLEVMYDEVLADLKSRDEQDSSRAVAPLIAAADAIVVDTDGRTIEEVVVEIQQIAQQVWDEVQVDA